MSQLDVSLLSGGAILPVSNPSGFIVERPSTAAASLKELMEAFFIDARETDGKLQFLPRACGIIVQSAFKQETDGLDGTLTLPGTSVPGNILFAFYRSFVSPSTTSDPTISDSAPNSWTPLQVGHDANGCWGLWWCEAVATPNLTFTPAGLFVFQLDSYLLEIGGVTSPPDFSWTTVLGTSPLVSATLDGVSMNAQFGMTTTDQGQVGLLVFSNGKTPLFALAVVNGVPDGGPSISAGWQEAFPSANYGINGGVYFQSPMFLIPERDLGLVKDKAKLIEALAQENDLPQAVTVLFNDQTLNYQQGKQLKGRNPRIITLETKNQKIMSLPFSLTPQQARQLAEAHLYSEWENRSSYAINLWRALYLLLDPGDWIQFVYEGLTFIARIVSCDVGRGAVVGLACVADDPRDYVSEAVGETNAAFVSPVSRTLAQTILYLLDMPLLRDGDANPGGSGFYAAMGSLSPDWLSASLFESSDDVNFSFLDNSDGPVAFGGALTILAAPRSPWDWDTVNSLTVQMQSGTLAGDTDINVMNGANALIVGDEIIQFADCVDNGGGSFTVSRLLRGRRGTEWACGTHVADETVIAVTVAGALLREQRPLAEIGQLRHYRGVTGGDVVTDAPDNDLTLAGNDLKPYAPCHIGGFLDANSNVLITWMRRTRVGWASLSQDPVPLSEDSELYDVDILNGSGVVIRTIANVSVPTAIYLATQIATDFGTLPANGVTVKVYQKSAQVGRGFAGTGVVPTPGGWPIPLPATSVQKTFLVNGS